MTTVVDRRATRGRATGRRVAVGVTEGEAAYADRLRRSAGWTPKHLAATSDVVERLPR